MPNFQHGSQIIHYEVLGTGRPVVLIHGFTNHGLVWLPQVTELVYNGFQVVLPDLPGHGLSSFVRDVITVQQMSDLMIGLFDHLKLEKPDVCGLSLGGMIVQNLVVTHPERIRKAVIANSSPNFNSNQSRAAVEHWKSMFLQPNGPQVRLQQTWELLFSPDFLSTPQAAVQYATWTRVLERMSGESLAYVAEGMLQFDVREKLPNVQTPTLVIAGKLDRLIPMEAAQDIQSKVPNAQFLVLENAGHISSVDSSAEFNKGLLDFLKG
ncbi:alpha/beta fold hydrolase [Alicyclobacillus tolerans]|uniref:alpha/beta fold hydrolase n=1 Tax=Alicyclobacillus tolerans TaxID=90970 RepID=UPI001F3BD7CD|nr:alpha/beta fold hydrolase [Alicyclobacillus tolerans]MCF8565556.1 alpha/beta fold hydrolase [Alicyclobacillus tolerans]